jgi:beta-galactosidase
MTGNPLKKTLLRSWQMRREDAALWADVILPHNAAPADADGAGHWTGLCAYRCRVCAGFVDRESVVTLYFHGAMHTAVASLDGSVVGVHKGGYLPFEIDVTERVRDGLVHELVVELDNRDNPDIPPGKKLGELDFLWYGGLYRDVELRVYPGVHITDACAAGEVAGGGLFVRTLEASEECATVSLRAQVRSVCQAARTVIPRARILKDGEEVATLVSEPMQLAALSAANRNFVFRIARPALWSLRSPSLYEVELALVGADGSVVDVRRERFGIRTIEMSRSGGLVLNGVRIRPRGTNRHQEHPYAGYALPAAAQRRDAVRIKEAGFDYVRLSHYPQSPDFLDACDELGILVMNCIPGWQFFGGEVFRNACFEDARCLIRRDRNHPCVILWELSLNETDMDDAFMEKMRRIGHEEYPGDQMYTCGWKDSYDVFIHSRQHGCIHTWTNGDKSLVVAEYGDWEYYAVNEGFDQKSGRGLLDSASNSRALRGDGEKKQLRQAANFAEALDDTLASPALTDGQWVMFDYARGYESFRSSCGVMDSFRLPKYAFHFYRSQRDADDIVAGRECGPAVFVASDWTEASSTLVTVFSNAREVALYLNGRPVGKQKSPAVGSLKHLPHPPFTFETGRFEPGTLKAVALCDGVEVASHSVTTPGRPDRLRIEIDEAHVPFADVGDVVFAHVYVEDANGVTCRGASPDVSLSVRGPLAVVGPSETAAEAGIASFLIRRTGIGPVSITAVADGLASVNI